MSLTRTQTTTTTAVRRRSGSIKLSTKPALDEVAKVEKYVVPNLTINDLLKVIPYVTYIPPTLLQSFLTKEFYRPHCFERNGWRSSLYLSV